MTSFDSAFGTFVQPESAIPPNESGEPRFDLVIMNMYMGTIRIMPGWGKKIEIPNAYLVLARIEVSA